MFRGNLQNVSFHRGFYQPNWFVIPFYQRPSAGREVTRELEYEGVLRRVARKCIYLCPDGELSDLSV